MPKAAKLTFEIDAPTIADFEALTERVAAAETALAALALRVSALEIKPLPSADRISFEPAQGRLARPVSKGAVIGTLSIEPATWAGELVLSGADADTVDIDEQLRLIASKDIERARDYQVIVTASP